MIFDYSLTDILNILLIVGVLATWFHYVALRPIKQLLFTLKDDLRDLANEIKASREDRRHFDARITALESGLKSAHKRIDELKSEVERLLARTHN